MLRLQKIGSYIVAGATLLTPTQYFGIRADEQQIAIAEDPSNPEYLKGKEESKIQAEIKKAIESPDSEFAKRLFSNPALKLKEEHIKIVLEKYLNTPLARILAERVDFSIADEHIKIKDENPEAEFSKGLSRNLNHEVNIGKPTYVTDASFIKKALEASEKKLVLIDFWAPWCVYCLKLNPLLDRVAERYKEKALILKLNVDINPETKESLNPKITGINEYKQQIEKGPPVLMCIKKGFIVQYNIVETVDAIDKKISKARGRESTDEEYYKLFEETTVRTMEKHIGK